MRRIMLLCAAVVLSAASAFAAEKFSPKIAPVPESTWTSEQRDLAAQFPNGPRGNALGTFLNHPEMVRGTFPFASYILADSSLTPRQRELLILRTAWLCSSQYLWADHVPRAKAAGISEGEIARIALGPDAKGWDPFEAALLRAADELHQASFVSTPTWNTLATKFDIDHLMDATFTVTESTQFATIYNSVDVAPDAGHTARLPAKGSRPTGPRRHEFLTAARISALEPAEWTPDVRKMLDPSGSGRRIIALYRTFAHNPKLYAPRQLQSGHINGKTTLAQREKEMIIVRIATLTDGPYPWAEHAPGARRAGVSDDEIKRLSSPGPVMGFSAKETALLNAVDDIYAADKISDATWAALAANYDNRQILDLMVAAAGYRMVAMVANTFGVQLEAGAERMPETSVP